MTAHPCCVPKGSGPCSVRCGGRCVLLSKTPPGDKQVMFGPLRCGIATGLHFRVEGPRR
jgi:hypothetical protein